MSPCGFADAQQRSSVVASFYGETQGEAAMSREVVGARLQARASELILASSPGMGLDVVWPHGEPVEKSQGFSLKEELLWQQILINLGGGVPATMRAASHFSKVLEAGLDANAVCFPHKALREGFPKPLPVLKPARKLGVHDFNTLLFPPPGKQSIKKKVMWLNGVEDEIGDMWLQGLAVHPFDLRATMHSNTTMLKMELTSCPMKHADALEGDEAFIGLPANDRHTVVYQGFCVAKDCVIKDTGFFDDSRYLRAEMHADPFEFSMDTEPWPNLKDNMIKHDLLTLTQFELLQRRERRSLLSEEQLEKRRADLYKKLSGPYQMPGEAWPKPRFFEQILPAQEKEAALAEARSRKVAERVCIEREREEAAELGAQFVVWPIAGTRQWPKPAPAWTGFCQWFAKRQGLRQALQQEMESAPTSQESSTSTEQMDSAWLRFVHQLSSASTTVCKVESCTSNESVTSAWHRFMSKLSTTLPPCEVESGLPTEESNTEELCTRQSAWPRIVQKLCMGPKVESFLPHEESCMSRQTMKSAWRRFVDKLVSSPDDEEDTLLACESVKPAWLRVLEGVNGSPAPSCESSKTMKPAWLHFRNTLGITSTSCNCSEADWEAVSECSDSSSWQLTSELDWLDWELESIIPECQSAAEIQCTGKLLARGANERMFAECQEAVAAEPGDDVIKLRMQSKQSTLERMQ